MTTFTSLLYNLFSGTPSFIIFISYFKASRSNPVFVLYVCVFVCVAKFTGKCLWQPWIKSHNVKYNLLPVLLCVHVDERYMNDSGLPFLRKFLGLPSVSIIHLYASWVGSINNTGLELYACWSDHIYFPSLYPVVTCFLSWVLVILTGFDTFVSITACFSCSCPARWDIDK